MKSDKELITDCLNGDQLAYKQMYERYISYCYGMCTRYSVSHSEIKDLVQIIFTQVFHSLKNYDHEKAQFKTWLTRICINHILSHRKKKIKILSTQNLDDIKELEALSSENTVESNINKEYLLSVIKKMPDNYQIVFNLFVIDGYTHKEISDELNISTASSRVVLNRARSWVKKTLANHLISQNEGA